MIYKDLARLIDYDIPYIEVYNEFGDLEYILDLDNVDFTDIEIVYSTQTTDYYGVIKLKRYNEQAEPNDKKL